MTELKRKHYSGKSICIKKTGQNSRGKKTEAVSYFLNQTVGHHLWPSDSNNISIKTLTYDVYFLTREYYMRTYSNISGVPSWQCATHSMLTGLCRCVGGLSERKSRTKSRLNTTFALPSDIVNIETLRHGWNTLKNLMLFPILRWQ